MVPPVTLANRGPGEIYDFLVVGGVNGTAAGGETGAVVTKLSDFSSSGLNTNNLSCGVSIAWTQTCRLIALATRGNILRYTHLVTHNNSGG